MFPVLLLCTNYVRFRPHIDRIHKSGNRNVRQQKPEEQLNSTDIELVAAEMVDQEVSDSPEQEVQPTIVNRTSSSKKQLCNFKRIPAFYKSPRTKFTVNSVGSGNNQELVFNSLLFFLIIKVYYPILIIDKEIYIKSHLLYQYLVSFLALAYADILDETIFLTAILSMFSTCRIQSK